MQMNDDLIVKVDKLSNSGTGIARVNGFVLFIGNACPGDILKVKITKLTKAYAYAKILEIINPSPHRVEPFCPVQKVCGACQLQFINYDYQLELKRLIVEDAMKSIGGFNIVVPKTVPSPEPKIYRHKIQYPVSQTKISKRLIAGYYKTHSHDIVNIKYCPIQPGICDKIVEYIRVKAFDYGISGYNEKKHCGDLRHIVLRVSAYNGNVLVTLVLNAVKSFRHVKDFAEEIFKEFEEVTGVCLNFNPNKTNLILSGDTECVCGKDYVEEIILDKVFKIGAGTFFQVNPKSAENIFSYVKDEVSTFNNPVVLDAYAGIAAFGVVVSEAAEKIVSVEENLNSIKNARDVFILNNIKNIELHAEDTTKYLKSVKRKFDITILDPPRKGCSKEALDEAFNHTKEEIIYISCNPAALARDLRYLCKKGCTLKSVQPFDMFCHTYHVETVAVIRI